MPLPLPKAFWPATVTAANKVVNVTVGATPYVANVAEGTYYSAALLAAAVQTALTAAVANAWSVSVSSTTGKVTVSGTSAFSLKFSTGAGAASSPRHLLGFGAVDTVSGTTATGQYQHQNGWYAVDPVQDDTGELPLYERGQSVALGGNGYALDFGTRYQRVIRLGFLPAWKTWSAEEGANLNEAIERLFDAGWQRLRWWPDASVEGAYSDLVMDLDTAKTLPRERLSPGNPLYALRMKFWKFVP